jgi:pantoate--beta-alanine ligase
MPLEIAKTVAEVRQAVRTARQGGLIVSLAPTMGALHAGHASLFRAARKESDFVVVSLFVNPAQFAPNEDFGRYPRTWDEDVALCQTEKVDVLFAPSVEEVYPPGFCTYVEVTQLQDGLCGAQRPGHFRGVATVVLKLFNIVEPDLAYFGRKDAQQLRIIQRMAHDLKLPVAIRACPIVREPDGLALSSRNRYLSAQERLHATVLFRALETASRLVAQGVRDAGMIRADMRSMIDRTPGAVVDYVELVDEESLKPVQLIQGTVLAALAVRFGSTRLIDSALLMSAP